MKEQGQDHGKEFKLSKIKTRQDQGKQFNICRGQRSRRKNKDKIKVRSLIYLEDRGQEGRTRTKLFLNVVRSS